MGKAWDGDRGGAIQWINWLSEIMAEAMRVMKPGAVGAVWSIPRTCGYTQLALELAGFKIWDSVAVMNGNGFPKGQDIGKLIDAMQGRQRESVGRYERPDGGERRYQNWGRKEGTCYGDYGEETRAVTAPASPEAAHWDGWKTPALKPSHETWFLIQKPISESSVARNVLKHGVGGINVEAARIGTGGDRVNGGVRGASRIGFSFAPGHPRPTGGRYPANTILVCAPECTADNHADHCPVVILNQQTEGARASKPTMSGQTMSHTAMFGSAKGFGRQDYKDGGSGINAERYFLQLPHDPDTFRYFTKASPNDRSCNGAVENRHPTVKNRELMAYFARLLCPPGGTILDPFGGSGSTALGAIMAGMDFVLIEQDPESVATAKARISTLAPASPSVPTPSLEQRVTWLETQVKALRNQRQKPDDGQLRLFG